MLLNTPCLYLPSSYTLFHYILYPLFTPQKPLHLYPTLTPAPQLLQNLYTLILFTSIPWLSSSPLNPYIPFALVPFLPPCRRVLPLPYSYPFLHPLFIHLEMLLLSLHLQASYFSLKDHEIKPTFPRKTRIDTCFDVVEEATPPPIL